MKKLFVLMAAAFAMVACQTDINEVGVVGGEVDVTFEVGTPTRAYSDGTTATVLQYAVYEGTEELRDLTHSVANGKAETINIRKNVSFKLVTGNEYTVIFWAAAPDAPYSVDWATGTMTVDYSAAVCNAENRDAFFKKHTFTVKGAQTETIELRRPFAQLNIGTNDYAAATEAGYTPVNSAVKVTNVYKTLNLWNGAVSTPVEVNFDYNTIAKTETFPVTGYQYLAMNYLLVNSEKEVVDIEFGYTESDATVAKTRTVGSVPVQRNYRTNIYGQLLTSDVEINVVIVPEYETPDNNVESGLFSQVADVVGLQEAIDAAPVGELTTIIITEDLDLSATRALGYITRVENGSNIVIDGNGHTIKGGIRIVGQSDKTSETTVIRNINFVTEQNEIDFIASADFGFGNNYWRYANNVTVENCTFTAAELSADPKVVGVRFNQAYNVTVKNCEGRNLHSLCQFQSNDTAIVLEGLKAVNCKNGISLGTTKKVTINGLDIVAQEYGIRADGNALQSNTRCSLSVANATITAKQPIVARKVTAGYDLTLGEEVVLNTEELHQVVFTTTSDDVRPYVAPADGKYTFNSAADYIVFPRVDGEKVSEGLYKSEKAYLVTNAEGLAGINSKLKDQSAGKNVVVELLADIDFTGKTWTPVDSHADSRCTFKGLNGNGHTISNLTINGQAMFTRFAGGVNVEIKDVTFDNANVNSNGSINTSILTVHTYDNLLLDNVDVKNSTIIGGYKVAPLVGTVYNESPSTTVTATLKNCDVENTTVKATSYDFCTTGMVAFVYAGDNDKIEFENCTVSNVRLYAPNVYSAHAAIYATGSETLFNEAEGVTVTNVTFENI